MNCKGLEHDQKSEKGTITYDNYKDRQFIIQTWKNQILQKSKVSSPQSNLQTPSKETKKQILLGHKKSMNLTSERSTQMSTEKDLFNDKFIVEHQERMNILQKLQDIRLQNVMMKSKTKSSNDLYKEFQYEQYKKVDTQKVILNDKLKLCQKEIDQQKQKILKDEINLKEREKELEILKEQLQFVKDSVQQIKNQNIKQTRETTCKLQINQIKEKQLLTQFIQYIESLQDQYSNHLLLFKDYLFQLRLNIDSIRMDQEFDKNQ
ncbi:unnamed protein product (macronuclear) [Paramecium tetraurelia]|uniref:Chromosome undetermined scaffold_1, whole genome shotgun sequence n=1 Tax=Paramecium tetraurelia TaxID=5888 RepID=Q6BFX7_PARTE|nr:hypothetical protein [Paramecium tetraurelia strain d4-2]XP_001423233.1 uncharacterized protein GSPATT00000270001 [Paramecium tetraurelia]CAH03443.1 hypothetical protein PTMB.245c [Paramecium tetraurelia]CAK55835.1 unnamed protein product [Paramecium tetraurelia]|eukprot:XP_001423233.1 hypothetical protein (macronuclear) [Paramecium tetraurelia strain d4-2]